VHRDGRNGRGEKKPALDVVTLDQFRPPSLGVQSCNAFKSEPAHLPLSVHWPIPRHAAEYWTLMTIRILALLPFVGVLVGPWFLNRVTPLVFGMPLLLAWLVLWLLLTSAIMALIYRLDPANRPSAADDEQRP
jgi:hypothetical protein